MSRIEEIREAVGKGELAEPFGKKDLEKVFENWGKGTYSAYLWKHYVGKPGPGKEYFVKIAPGKFCLKR